MRKFLFPLLLLTGATAMTPAADAAPVAPGLGFSDAAYAQPVQFFDGGRHEAWRRHEDYERWRRHVEWRHEHEWRRREALRHEYWHGGW